MGKHTSCQNARLAVHATEVELLSSATLIWDTHITVLIYFS
jgi:hypothetical protein